MFSCKKRSKSWFNLIRTETTSFGQTKVQLSGLGGGVTPVTWIQIKLESLKSGPNNIGVTFTGEQKLTHIPPVLRNKLYSLNAKIDPTVTKSTSCWYEVHIYAQTSNS